MANVPNTLSSLRIAAAPLLILLGVLGLKWWFIGALIFSILTDCLDGYLARRLHQVTRFGATLDSWGDCATVVAVPFGAFTIWPDRMNSELVFVLIALISYLIPTLLGMFKYGLPPNYHTWGAKLSAVMLSLSLLTLFMINNPWLLRLSAPIFILECIEETAMTLILPGRQGNIPSLWHALRMRKRMPDRKAEA